MTNNELRAALIAYVNDSCDQLADDDYTDYADDIARVQRLMQNANLVHVLHTYEAKA